MDRSVVSRGQGKLVEDECDSRMVSIPCTHDRLSVVDLSDAQNLPFDEIGTYACSLWSDGLHQGCLLKGVASLWRMYDRHANSIHLICYE